MNRIFFSKKTKERHLVDSGYNGKTGVISYVISVLLHLGIFSAMILLQSFHLPNKDMPPAVQVDLISYDPAIQKISDSPQKGKTIPVEAEKSPPPETEEKPAQEVKKSVETITPDLSLKSKPDRIEKTEEPVKKKEKISLKQKTYNPEKVIEAARENIKKSVEKEKEDKLADALSRIEQRVKGQEKTGERPAGQDGDASQWQKGSTAINIYNSLLASAIQQNWSFNERLAGIDKDLETTVVIKILKNGSIADMWIETRSGNRYLDKSALRAIRKSDPLPSLPEGYASYDVGLNFSPKGLK